MQNLSSEMQQCIQNCLDCHSTCLHMAATHCLQMGGPHVQQNHYRLMLDCAQICQVSADFMLRSSPHHPHLCRECAEICRSCADDCERVGDMEECVKACRTCAESCSAMASA